MCRFNDILKNKELILALYFLFFCLGKTIGISNNFYNEYRVIEILLLLFLGWYCGYIKNYSLSKKELLFLSFILFGSIFWNNYQFILIDLLIFLVLYKSFQFLNYNDLVTKIIILASFLVFLMFPISLVDYIITGQYSRIWYPLPWNIRVYNSYFLVVSIFSVWFYIKVSQYRFIYILFLFLSFLSILLDAGRSATLSYTLFITIIVVFNKKVRWPLIATYFASFSAYIMITYLANLNNLAPLTLRIARESSSGRYDLWVNAFKCWSSNPILGCGFYQLDGFENYSAHPHNLFIQVLTETGLVGFVFLLFIMFSIFKKIDWKSKYNYFVSAALLAVATDLSLSGAHIYPINQITLLWFFVFILKNPIFLKLGYVSNLYASVKKSNDYISIIIYSFITIIFLYLFISTKVLQEIEARDFTPPRFWEYGYQLF